MADFPEMGTFGAEFACLDAPRSSSSMADQLLANATELDTSGWMSVCLELLNRLLRTGIEYDSDYLSNRDWAKAGCSNGRPIGSE